MKNNNQPSRTNISITDYFLQNGSNSYIISSNTPPASEAASQFKKRLEAYAEYTTETGKTASKP